MQTFVIRQFKSELIESTNETIKVEYSVIGFEHKLYIKDILYRSSHMCYDVGRDTVYLYVCFRYWNINEELAVIDTKKNNPRKLV